MADPGEVTPIFRPFKSFGVSYEAANFFCNPMTRPKESFCSATAVILILFLVPE